ncbi:MAG: XdhC family protein, partial [Hyphomonas sp.]|nr:XdhC family protein [Hyphomonas sp.]
MPLMSGSAPLYAEHPQDVLGQWLAWRQEGPVALVMVASTEGGSVRAPGALMAVSASGQKCGYISGGCVDADVVLQARQSIEDGKPRSLRYGTGSPFIDMPLPCGGAIDMM